MVKKNFLDYFIGTIMILSVSASATGQPNTVERDIKNVMKQLEVVGLSVAVVKGDEIIYTKAFGQKNIESNTPLTSEDIFRIASISKSFSATAIMQLAEAGKLSLNDDFSNLIGFKIRNPKFPETIITLKMLLSHTSSINDSEGYFNLDVINPAKSPNWMKCYNDYEPGKGYQYCNLNFNMVGTVIEKLSRERFDQYIKHHILDRLGLYGGYIVDSLDNKRFTTLYEYDSTTAKFIPSPLAYASRREELRNYVMGYSTPVLSPTGGMKISTPDLARYMIMHMNKGEYKGVRIISKKSAKRMQKKISTEEGYGLAIMNKTDLIRGKVMTGHTGEAYGLYSAMFFQPKEKFGMVVITNGCKPGDTDGVNRVLKETMSLLYDHFINQKR